MEETADDPVIPETINTCYRHKCPAMQLIVHEAILQSGILYQGDYFTQRLNGSLEGFRRGGLEFADCKGPDDSFGRIRCGVMGLFEPRELATKRSRIS